MKYYLIYSAIAITFYCGGFLIFLMKNRDKNKNNC